MSWLDSIRGVLFRSSATSQRSTSGNGGRGADAIGPIRARYDLAQTHDENSRHFANADNLSAKAANSAGVRHVMRKRSRYEAANNPQFKRIVKAYVKDVIGTGPRLQLSSGHENFDEFVSKHWNRWFKAVRYVRKLRVSLSGRTINGESFRLRTSNPKLPTEVKLDIQPFEADRCASLSENLTDPHKVDGIDFDVYGNPVTYWIWDSHPGDLSQISTAPRPVSADYVTHWFSEEREEQLRGVPELHSSVELMAHGRRFRRATVMKAEAAASTNGVIYSDVPSGSMPDDFQQGPVDFDRNTDHVLPFGWKREEYEQKSPNDTYEMFNREMASESGAPLGMTANVSSGNSSQYNFSSTRYDGEHWFGEVDCQREDCELIVINPDFQAWFAEFRLTDTFTAWSESDQAADATDDGPEVISVDDAVDGLVSGDSVGWEWDGHPEVDQVKAATGSDMDIAAGRSSTETETAARGRSARTEAKKQAKYLGMTIQQYQRAQRIKQFGFDPNDPNALPPGATQDSPAVSDQKQAARQTVQESVPSSISRRSQPVGGRT